MDRRVIVGAIGGCALIAIVIGASFGWYERAPVEGVTIIDAPADAFAPPIASASPPATSEPPPPTFVGRLTLPTIVVRSPIQTQKRLSISHPAVHFFDFRHAHCDRVESLAGSVTRCSGNR